MNSKRQRSTLQEGNRQCYINLTRQKSVDKRRTVNGGPLTLKEHVNLKRKRRTLQEDNRRSVTLTSQDKRVLIGEQLIAGHLLLKTPDFQEVEVYISRGQEGACDINLTRQKS